MKFYITAEPVNKLKKSFLNLKIFSIIDVQSILNEFGYTYSTVDDYSAYVISNHIENLIKTYAKSKRIRGIIYSNVNMNEDLLQHMITFLSSIEKINNVVLFDDYNVPKLEKFYYMFDEIIYFPSIKKIRLIECVNMI